MMNICFPNFTVMNNSVIIVALSFFFFFNVLVLLFLEYKFLEVRLLGHETCIP